MDILFHIIIVIIGGAILYNDIGRNYSRFTVKKYFLKCSLEVLFGSPILFIYLYYILVVPKNIILCIIIFLVIFILYIILSITTYRSDQKNKANDDAFIDSISDFIKKNPYYEELKTISSIKNMTLKLEYSYKEHLIFNNDYTYTLSIILCGLYRTERIDIIIIENSKKKKYIELEEVEMGIISLIEIIK